MTADQSRHSSRIDSLMEQASTALVERRYFDAEKLALEALRKAHALRDYDRIARIVLPLQESRRQIRDAAFDAGTSFLVTAELPSGKHLVSGCYLLCPPRVGVDGRLLRENAEKRKVPTIIVVREPTTRDGLWPLVAVGPATVRVRMKPPAAPPAPRRSEAKRSGSPQTKKGARSIAPGSGLHAAASVTNGPRSTSPFGIEPVVPDPEWFLVANETLGDAAIQSVSPDLPAADKVDAFIALLDAVPDHEKLHQSLAECARQAAINPGRKPKPAGVGAIDPLEEELSGDDA